jgi:hypothetical protein
MGCLAGGISLAWYLRHSFHRRQRRLRALAWLTGNLSSAEDDGVVPLLGQGFGKPSVNREAEEEEEEEEEQDRLREATFDLLDSSDDETDSLPAAVTRRARASSTVHIPSHSKLSAGENDAGAWATRFAPLRSSAQEPLIDPHRLCLEETLELLASANFAAAK